MMDETASFAPVERIAGDPRSPWLLLCDHASNRLPPDYGDLGLPAAEFERHIAYDIGAAGVTRGLAAALGAPAVMTTWSRLLIDPNRGEDDPTLVMRLSDGAIVPGNRHVDPAERDRRIARFHRPYHDAVANEITAMRARGLVPVILAVHSFTPFWKGVPRPWHAGVLWDRDPRLALPLIAALERDGDLVVGDNEPYLGALKGDTMYRHGTAAGLPHALLEIRQDLIGDPGGIADWVDRLARRLPPLLASEDLRAVRLHGSKADQPG
ncbi:N-formylglutamate amidohydrolase [Methylobrevis pamukkalensis]|uniref:N-formylglutamate amidohydrolase n=1 Tax=Methylobrevis pamukkalensis TaxID=1439726 RepID=A0A1E3GYM3_9HYPH|nr:N-formylglutamate amidohydrolase [Methylobrevis pamukkalensis]ODN69142.1 N-formylglutamate amidohydrolase [Methylobrevis pamukkalensis]